MGAWPHRWGLQHRVVIEAPFSKLCHDFSFESVPRQCDKDSDKAEQGMHPTDACLKEWLHIVSCILMVAANTHALHAVVDHQQVVTETLVFVPMTRRFSPLI